MNVGFVSLGHGAATRWRHCHDHRKQEFRGGRRVNGVSVGKLGMRPRRNAARVQMSLSEPVLFPETLRAAGTLFESYPRLMFSPESAALAHSGVPNLAPSALLWAFACYFGFSERVRWGTELNRRLRVALERSVLPPGEKVAVASSSDGQSSADAQSPPEPEHGAAELVAAALHSLPFLLAAIGIDTLLRKSVGETWTLSSATTAVLWSGVYELGRWSAGSFMSEEEKEAERKAYDAFCEFADRALKRSGRCHFSDVASAFRLQCPAYRTRSKLSDEQIRRFIRRAAPDAVRSPNGFYRNLSILSKQELRERAAQVQVSASRDREQ
ncbi:hypothetical protein FVE85_2113 [Porphyridium purpureum]|uniref:Uncharacterized protein n=1 Tax=Porphyridium purpureum TaxID=35688 RepID=A0A5J4YXV1_PORPP|nr:hypothetical protein FVE85_2113 [Porphyridium purpureum]|eukprot:POR0976..scf209_3